MSKLVETVEFTHPAERADPNFWRALEAVAAVYNVTIKCTGEQWESHQDNGPEVIA